MYCASESFVYIYIVFIFTKHTGEWILEMKISLFLFLSESDCCLTPSEQFFQLYHGESK